MAEQIYDIELPDGSSAAWTSPTGAPPTEVELDAILESLEFSAVEHVPAARSTGEAPSPSVADYALEGISGFNRPIAAMADIATSPAQLLMDAVGMDVPSFSEAVGPKGQFAGEGLLSQTVGTAGEFVGTGISFGMGAKGVYAVLDDALKQGDNVFMNVLEQLGSSSYKAEAVDSVLAGVGTELGEEVGGDAGAMIGGFATPVLGSLVSARSMIIKMLEKTVPTTSQLKGSSRALYTQLDDLNIVYNEQGVNNLRERFQSVADDEILTNLLPDKDVAVVFKNIMDNYLQPGEFSGINFKVLDKMRQALSKVASSDDTNARTAGQLVRELDDFIGTASTDLIGIGQGAIATRGTGIVPLSSVKNGADAHHISETYKEARSLWRRGAFSSQIDDIFETAAMHDLTSEARGGTDYTQGVINGVRKFIDENKDFITPQQRGLLEGVLKEGSLVKMLDKLGSVGVTSTDLVRTSLYGIVSTGAAGLYSGDIGTALAVGGGTMISMLIAGRGLHALTSNAATRILRNNARMTRTMLNAGSDPAEIIKTYTRLTPVAERNAEDLAVIIAASGAKGRDLTPFMPTGNRRGKARYGFIGESAVLANMFIDQIKQEKADEYNEQIDRNTTPQQPAQ